MVRPFTEAYYFIDFQLRKDYIAKVLCINKDRPELHCDGTCYLAKKVKALEERENQSQRNIFEKFELPTMICEEILSLKFQFTDFEVDLITPQYQNTYSKRLTFSIFRPPCLG
jgi:hypothetical protein